MVRVKGKLKDGTIICYLVPSYEGPGVLAWLRDKTPCVEAWMERANTW